MLFDNQVTTLQFPVVLNCGVERGLLVEIELVSVAAMTVTYNRDKHSSVDYDTNIRRIDSEEEGPFYIF